MTPAPADYEMFDFFVRLAEISPHVTDEVRAEIVDMMKFINDPRKVHNQAEMARFDRDGPQ